MPTDSARSRVQGVETFFLSADATDAAAAEVARLENSDDERVDRPQADGALGAILADLARSEAHANSAQLAYRVHDHVVRARQARDRGVRQAPFAVLQGAAMPAVLLEVGYISHPDESRRLAEPDEQEKIARAVAAAVDRFRREVLQKQARTTLGGKPGAAALR
jgi:N-acetylmuramoyl-L-alanine amidase